MLHPEEAWPRRWFQGRWALAALAVMVLLTIGVAGLLFARGEGEEASPAAPPPEPAVSAPESFTAKARGVAVHLSWSAPAGGVEVEHYDVYRNGSLLITLSDAGTTYVDDNIRPGKEYTYEIEARGTADGKELVSERVSTVIKPPVPSLAKARVAGDFNVKAKTLSETGYDTFNSQPFGWTLEAKCRSGPCDVVWNDLHEKKVHGVLKQKGARYTGTYSGFFFVLCESTRMTSSVSIDLKVVKANAINGEWQATKLKGTLKQSEAAQLGCGSSSATQALTVQLVR